MRINIAVNMPPGEFFHTFSCRSAYLGNLQTYMERVIRETQTELILLSYVFSADVDIWDFIIDNLKEKNISISIFFEKEAYPLAIENLKQKLKNFFRLKIYQLKPGLNFSLHSKIFISDWERALIGSANLTKRAFFSNYEIGIYIESYEHIAPLRCYIDNIRRYTQRI
jgi:phosphatidylserine/phosphatidylglycerophosphate/cardiolipin synthase-like enzyme